MRRRLTRVVLPVSWAILAAWSAAACAAQFEEKGDCPHLPAQMGTVPFFPPNIVQGHLELRLFEDAADGRWDDHSLLAAALVASGASDATSLQRYEARFAQWVAELRRSGRVTGSPRQKAEAVFAFMHGTCLRGGYQADCTVLTATLDQGRFNCVSASVLFHCLLSQFGVHAQGLETPGHAMSRLLLPEGRLDVETTCPEWFRLLGDPTKKAQTAANTLGTESPQGRVSRQGREVSDVQLVATIYYNRGLDLLEQQQFAQAVAANAKALRLDPGSTTARGNLLATLNNWAIAEAGAGRLGEAAELLRQGLAVDPGYATFQNNYRHVYRRWIAQLAAAGRGEEADRLAQQAAADPILAAPATPPAL